MPSSLLRRFFTVMVTPSLEDVYGVSISPTKYIIKPAKPVIFLQLYHCYLSPFDQEFHSMALSPDSFALGLQVSYPQVWENPNTHLFSKTFLEEGFACTPRFKAFMKWQRQKTRPALFERNQEKVYAPFRIGKTGDSLLVEHKGLQKALEKANIALKIKDGHER